MVLKYQFLDGEKMKWVTDDKSTRRKPVHATFMVAWAAIKKHYMKFIRLDKSVDEMDIQITELQMTYDITEDAPIGVIIIGRHGTLIDSAAVIDCSTCVVDKNNYKDFPVLLSDVDHVIKEVINYMESETIDSRQFLLELYDSEERSGKVDNLEYSKEDLDTMTEEEMTRISISHLEKKGVVMLNAEAAFSDIADDPMQ